MPLRPWCSVAIGPETIPCRASSSCWSPCRSVRRAGEPKAWKRDVVHRKRGLPLAGLVVEQNRSFGRHPLHHATTRLADGGVPRNRPSRRGDAAGGFSRPRNVNGFRSALDTLRATANG
ncbi:MAG: hypothetical protein U0736_18320 [Gemmataceae bacterium]